MSISSARPNASRRPPWLQSLALVAAISLLAPHSVLSSSSIPQYVAPADPAAFAPSLMIANSGHLISVTDGSDCAALNTAFLANWCSDLLTFSPASVSSDLSDRAMFDAAIVWAWVNDRSSICSAPQIDLYIEAAAHTETPVALCESNLASWSSQGYVQIMDEDTGETAIVGPSAASVLALTIGFPTTVQLGPAVSSAPSTEAEEARPLSVNANCNNLQQGNSFVTKTDSTAGSRIETFASITPYNYSLCSGAGLQVIQTGSGAWPALENGPRIAQIGYWKCQSSLACQVSIPSSEWNKLVYFWGCGNSSQLPNLPSPHYIAQVSGSASHVFVVRYEYLSTYGSYGFVLDIDYGAVAKVTMDTTCFNNAVPSRSEVGNESWNCGDQLGGSSGAPEQFRGAEWIDGNNVYHALAGGPSRGTFNGGPSPSWATWSVVSSTGWNTWTSSSSRSC